MFHPGSQSPSRYLWKVGRLPTSDTSFLSGNLSYFWIVIHSPISIHSSFNTQVFVFVFFPRLLWCPENHRMVSHKLQKNKLSTMSLRNVCQSFGWYLTLSLSVLQSKWEINTGVRWGIKRNQFFKTVNDSIQQCSLTPNWHHASPPSLSLNPRILMHTGHQGWILQSGVCL